MAKMEDETTEVLSSFYNKLVVTGVKFLNRFNPLSGDKTCTFTSGNPPKSTPLEVYTTSQRFCSSKITTLKIKLPAHWEINYIWCPESFDINAYDSPIVIFRLYILLDYIRSNI